MRNLLICLLILTGAAAGLAQTTSFELTEIEYHIDGITQEWALARVVEFEIGLVFEDQAELDEYVFAS